MKKVLKKIESTIVSLVSRISIVASSKYLYSKNQKKKLNLKEPKTFNEKLMYLKIYNYNNNPTVWRCSDKYQVRKYAKDKGLKDANLPKIISVYNSAKDIDFNKLPNKFAIKCSHGCGYNVICKDKNKLDKKKTIKQLQKWLNTKFGYETAELHYTHIKPCIICEQYIGDGQEFPNDYKFYCFNGKPMVVLVCTNREYGYKTHFYDINWKELKLRNNQSKIPISKPKSFCEMISICKKLSKEFPFVRIDLYEWNDHAILGEMTFTPAACLAKYTKKGDELLSNYLTINNVQ